jgi:hypothetical protein
MEINAFVRIHINLFLFVTIISSCSPSKVIIEELLHQTISAQKANPTFTYYPTYTNLPIPIIETTKIIVVTKTPTKTSQITNSVNPTMTNTPIPLEGNGKLIAFPDKNSTKMNYFDLDTGTNVNGPESDLEYSIGCGSACFGDFGPINGAISFIFGRSEPTYDYCKEHMVSETYFITNKNICVLTNSNNISIVESLTYTYLWDGSTVLTFHYKTWKNRI